MKKHILFLLCLITAASTRAQVFADHFADKTLRVDYIFNGNASGQAICLDGYPLSPPGQEESIIWRNSRCKATDRLLCAMQPAERLFILPLSPHSSRNGWKRTKPGM